jgi:hypothetical protein
VNIASKLEGQWIVEEISSVLKSADDFYSVTVEIYQSDSNKILIYNFYDLGDNIGIAANVNGMNLEIPKQTTSDGYTIYGSGSVSSSYKKIIWNYKVDINDGEINEVTDTYTRNY